MHSVIISIPKSGTNLVASYLNASGKKKAFFLGGKPASLLRWVSISRFQSITLGSEKPREVNRIVLDGALKLGKLRGDYCTTHTGCVPGTKEFFEERFQYIICVVRNPLDCFDSWLRYTPVGRNCTSNFDEFQQAADYYFFGGVLGKYEFLPLAMRYNSILAWRNSTKCIFIDYDRSIDEETFLRDQLQKAEVDVQHKDSYYGNSKTFRIGGSGAWHENRMLYDWVLRNSTKLTEQFRYIEYQPYSELSFK